MKIEPDTSVMKSVIVNSITEKFGRQILKYVLGFEDVSLNSLTNVKMCASFIHSIFIENVSLGGEQFCDER